MPTQNNQGPINSLLQSLDSLTIDDSIFDDNGSGNENINIDSDLNFDEGMDLQDTGNDLGDVGDDSDGLDDNDDDD